MGTKGLLVQDGICNGSACSGLFGLKLLRCWLLSLGWLGWGEGFGCFAEMSNILKEIEKGNSAAVKRILAINPNSVLVVDAAVSWTDMDLCVLFLQRRFALSRVFGHGACIGLDRFQPYLHHLSNGLLLILHGTYMLVQDDS